MAEYIERDALLSDIEAAEKHKGMGMVVAQTLKRYVKRAPAADVAPVMHARWIRGVPGDNEPRCSNCLGYQPWFFGYGYYDPDHCPHCGAIMDLREQVDEDEQDL